MEKRKKQYDVIVIGAGLAGLTAASLLAKRGQQVLVLDYSNTPGGACGVFKRHQATFDQGSAMLYGFGEKGFNAHSFVFNCLEEPIDMIQHDYLYAVNYQGHRIRFHQNIDRFIEELTEVFPAEKENLQRFYRDMGTLYQHVMVESPAYTTADEADKGNHMRGMLRHPISYIRFLSYLNKSAKTLLQKYFKNPEIFNFFDKMTSTYCYATVDEAPAILASVMFVDNHVGGSYYPAGSTLFLPGKLEKVIEEQGGTCLYHTEVTKLIIDKKRVLGVETGSGERYMARDIVYSGTVWNLYEKLIPQEKRSEKKHQWARAQKPTYPSLMLYAIVDKEVIDEDATPIEMLVGNPQKIDESEVTVYILSIDDRTLCGEDEHVMMVIGPSFKNWEDLDQVEYQEEKKRQTERLVQVVEKRFSGFGDHLRFKELATPETLHRYLLKRAVAGPKQELGQHMFKRLKTRTEYENLYACGESTVMGTGTPTVTTSGIAAANAILKKQDLPSYKYDPQQKNVVNIVEKPVTVESLYPNNPKEKPLMVEALRCQFCERPMCYGPVIPDIMRRVAVGNFVGARKQFERLPEDADLQEFEGNCILKRLAKPPIRIKNIVESLRE